MEEDSESEYYSSSEEEEFEEQDEILTDEEVYDLELLFRKNEETDKLEKIGALRLDVLSLKSVANLITRPEFQEYFEQQCGHAIFWEIAKSVIATAYAAENGIMAVCLMKTLVYFGASIIDTAILPSNVQNLITILKTCGLIDVKMTKAPYSVTGELIETIKLKFVDIILEGNDESNEVNELRECLEMLRKFREAKSYVPDKVFPALWTKVSKYPDLIREFRFVCFSFCNYKRRDPNFNKIILNVLTRLLELYGIDDNFGSDCYEMKVTCVLESPNLRNEFKLKEWQDYYSTHKHYFQTNLNSMGEWTARRWIDKLDILYNCADSIETSDFRTEFLEECLRGFTTVFDYHAASSIEVAIERCIIGIFKCCHDLGRFEKIVEMLKQILAILDSRRNQEDALPIFEDSCFSLYEIVLNFFEESFYTRGDSEFEVLKQLAINMKILYDSMKNEENFMVRRVADTFFNSYMMCLKKLGDSDQILEMVPTAKELWHKKFDLAYNLRMNIIELSNAYFNFYKNVFLLAINEPTYSALLCESIDIEAFKPIISLAIHRNKKVKICDEETSKKELDFYSLSSSHVIRCYLISESGSVDQLIEYLSDYEERLILRLNRCGEHYCPGRIFLKCVSKCPREIGVAFSKSIILKTREFLGEIDESQVDDINEKGAKLIRLYEERMSGTGSAQ